MWTQEDDLRLFLCALVSCIALNYSWTLLMHERRKRGGQLIAADRKIWAAIADLVAQSWSLDDALHELTAIRNDVSSLLQLRPRGPLEKGKGQLGFRAQGLGLLFRV